MTTNLVCLPQKLWAHKLKTHEISDTYLNSYALYGKNEENQNGRKLYNGTIYETIGVFNCL